MGMNKCFCKIIADVFPPWHCVVKTPSDQQTAKTFAFIKVLTLTFFYSYGVKDVLYFLQCFYVLSPFLLK